ncbi:MAG: hypothetical protein IKT97_07880 [Spirochaetia bacterium]|nr:hypothetical protein [Spirochaetia bacterium]
MKLTKSLLAFLAMCLVLTLTGCGDGSSDSFNSEFADITKGSGKKFIVYDIDPHISITDFSRVSGKGIKFKESGTLIEIYVTIFLNDNKSFTSTEEIKMGGMAIGNSQFTGTWSQSGQTLSMHATKEKDLLTGQTKTIDETEKTTLSADGNTMTDVDENPDIHAKLVYKKQ